jgi:riboflavin kinase/FMN adenylyltransferase
MAEIMREESIGRLAGAQTVVSIGVFDGVHAGHQKVISTAEAVAASSVEGKMVLVTFDRHPLSVTHPDMAPRLLTTLDEKVSLLERTGADYIFIERFDLDTAGMDYAEYIGERLIGGLGMKHLVVGYDFHLGRGRMGGRDALERIGGESGFGVTIVPPVVISGTAVSSTRIRRHVMEKKLRRAAKFLTRHYFFDADVIRGEGIGRALEFPTANACISHEEKLVPPGGVYAVIVESGGVRSGGMMNVGFAPTVSCGGKKKIEIHLFDFEGDLYGQRLRIHCVEHLRDEKKFSDREKLRAQLLQDRENAMLILQKKH